MQIVSISPSLDQKNFIVFLSNNKKIIVSSKILLDLKLVGGMNLTAQQLNLIKSSAKKDRIYTNTLNLLSRRRKTKNEVIDYLARKEVYKDQAKEIIDKLTNLGLIDDSKYIDSFVNDLSLKSPVSSKEIKYKLLKKGISKNLIEEFFSNNEEDESKKIKELILIKRRQSKYQDDLKLTAYLVRKGFNYGKVKDAIKSEQD